MIQSVILLIICAVAAILVVLGYLYLLFVVANLFKMRALHVPFVASDRKGIVQLVRFAKLIGGEKVIDIGSGTGDIVFTVASLFPDTSVNGVEINPILHLIACIRQILFHNSRNVHLQHGDATKIDYSSYDIIFVFMLPKFMDELMMPKLAGELRSGAKVVSYVFQLDTVKEQFIEQEYAIPRNGWKGKVYVYTRK